MARLVSGGKILSDGTFQKYNKSTGDYETVMENKGGKRQPFKVDESNFGNTAVGQTTDYLGDSLQEYNVLNSNLRGPNLELPGKQNTPSVVSSDSALNDRDTQDAMNQAGNALTMGTGTGMTPYEQNYINIATQNQKAGIEAMGEQLSALDQMYDAQLGRVNMQYDQQMQDLRQSFEGQKQYAEAQAAALNPYSQAQGAMTARNFTGAIENEYQKQARRLRDAAAQAQAELAAGNAQAYTEITQAMAESNRQFKQQMAEFMLNANRQAQQQQMEERRFGLQQAQFGLQQQRFGLERQEYGENRFMDFVNEFGADPAFQQNLQRFYETGEINEALTPLVERGIAAGLSPAETLSIAQYETQAQRQNRQLQEYRQGQLGVSWYNAETSRMNALRQIQQANREATESITEKNTLASEFTSRSKNVLQKGEQALQRLMSPNWFETGVAGQAVSWIGATPAGDLESVYSTMKGNISFDQLAKMRAESPTGGALGQVSNVEIGLLADAEGALSSSLQRETQMNNVAEIMAAYTNTETAIRLDRQVQGGELTQEEANQIMSEQVVSRQDILTEMQNRVQSATPETTAASTPAINSYLDSMGYGTSQ